MFCKTCGIELSSERLEAKPDAEECVPCVAKQGDVLMYRGRMIFSHKTAGELEIVSKQTLDDINRIDRRGYKRPSNLS